MNMRGLTLRCVNMFRCGYFICHNRPEFYRVREVWVVHWSSVNFPNVVSAQLYLLPPSFQLLGCCIIISQESHSCFCSTSVRLLWKSVVNTGQMGKGFWLQLIKPKEDRDQMWKTSAQEKNVIKWLASKKESLKSKTSCFLNMF